MTKFEKILLTIDIVLFIVGAIIFCQDSIMGEQIGLYFLVAMFLVTVILFGSGFANSKSNIFDNHTNINITINYKEKESKN